VDGRQLVDRDVEEALDLALVKVHRQHPIRAGDGDHVRDQAGGDRDPGLVLLVRPAVGVERDDRRDPTCARPLEGVDHDQELHDRLVDGMARRLDEEDVLLADVVENLDEDVLVGELEDLDLAGLGIEVAGDLPGKVRVRVAGVDLELVCVHRRLQLAEPRHGVVQAPDPEPGPSPDPPSGSPLSPMLPRSASPARNAAIATTRSPSFIRMVITPRAWAF
jgi:hypothetical protein